MRAYGADASPQFKRYPEICTALPVVVPSHSTALMLVMFWSWQVSLSISVILKAPLDPTTESFPALALMKGCRGTVLQMLESPLVISIWSLLLDNLKPPPRSQAPVVNVARTTCFEAAQPRLSAAVVRKHRMMVSNQGDRKPVPSHQWKLLHFVLLEFGQLANANNPSPAIADGAQLRSMPFRNRKSIVWRNVVEKSRLMSRSLQKT